MSRWQPPSAFRPSVFIRSTSGPACPGVRHSCQWSLLTIITGALSQAPRHSIGMIVNMPVGSVCAALDAQLLLERLDHAFGAGQRARQRRAHLQHEGAHRRAVEHHVIGDDVLDFRGGAADDLGDVTRGVRRDVALLLLRQVERVQHRRLAMLGRVVRRERLELGTGLRRELELGPFRQYGPLRAVPLVRAVGHGGMKTHRSTSPITTSSEPMTAMTSAIIPPTMNLCSA